MAENTINTASAPYVVMVKPVGSRCNMRCRYCYYLDNPEQSESSCMSHETLRDLILQHTHTCPGRVVSFVWHGGEPTLAGLDFYREAVRLQKELCPPEKEVWNNLQTNGLALNEEWCSFLAEEHFDVGLSLDGSKLTHDALRRDAGGRATYARIVRNVRLLQEKGLQPDLLCTVNEETQKDPLGVYRALKELGTGWIQFIPVICEGNAPGTDGENYGSFLRVIFEEWLKHDIGICDVQLFAETMMVLMGGHPSLCTLQETCGRALVVEKDGRIYACDHYVRKDCCRGSLQEGLYQAVEDPAQKAFGEAKRGLLSADCQQCPYLVFCRGGCLKDRREGRYLLCEGMKKYYETALPKLQELIALRRQRKSVEEIRKHFA
ncbi:MAG: anaerobic sulfatase maturase [Erysipelotrichaceae bacterium]|nr:anaerobic sulfatase maturase [Erysipelotrichaceae bacterium]